MNLIMPPQVKANRRGLAEGVLTVLTNDSSRLICYHTSELVVQTRDTLMGCSNECICCKHEVKPELAGDLFLSALPNSVKNHVGDLWTFLCMSEDFYSMYYSLFYSYSVAQLNTWPLRWWKPLMKKLASTISAVTCGASASSSTSC